MNFKHLGADDTRLIAAIAKTSWYDTYLPILDEKQLVYMLEAMYTDEALRAQMEEGQTFFGIFEGEEAAGFSAISDLGEGLFKLNKIYLLPEFQGGGRGKALLNHAEEKACEAGADAILLNVNRHNKARFFYEKQGYNIIREEDVPIGPYWMNDYVLMKKL